MYKYNKVIASSKFWFWNFIRHKLFGLIKIGFYLLEMPHNYRIHVPFSAEKNQNRRTRTYIGLPHLLFWPIDSRYDQCTEDQSSRMRDETLIIKVVIFIFLYPSYVPQRQFRLVVVTRTLRYVI